MNGEVTAVLFKNFSEEEFVCSWDSIPYRFKPGQEMYLEDWKAAHFTKHLVDREINKTGGLTSDKVLRKNLEVKASPAGDEVAIDELLDAQVREEIAEKKKTSKQKKSETEEEFTTLT